MRHRSKIMKWVVAALFLLFIGPFWWHNFHFIIKASSDSRKAEIQKDSQLIDKMFQEKQISIKTRGRNFITFQTYREQKWNTGEKVNDLQILDPNNINNALVNWVEGNNIMADKEIKSASPQGTRLGDFKVEITREMTSLDFATLTDRIIEKINKEECHGHVKLTKNGNTIKVVCSDSPNVYGMSFNDQRFTAVNITESCIRNTKYNPVTGHHEFDCKEIINMETTVILPANYS